MRDKVVKNEDETEEAQTGQSPDATQVIIKSEDGPKDKTPIVEHHEDSLDVTIKSEDGARYKATMVEIKK